MPQKQKNLKTVRLNEAQQKLVEDNIPLVNFFIGKYCRIYSRARRKEMEDLRQDLHIGLCRAAFEYRPELGGFAGYAIWWFRSFLTTWRRKLPPIGLASLSDVFRIDGTNYEPIDENSDMRLDLWRQYIETLTPEERLLISEIRQPDIKRSEVRLAQHSFEKKRCELILKMRREFVS